MKRSILNKKEEKKTDKNKKNERILSLIDSYK